MSQGCVSRITSTLLVISCGREVCPIDSGAVAVISATSTIVVDDDDDDDEGGGDIVVVLS